MQKTILRLQAGEYEDGGWQTAKSNNKKKNHSIEQVSNGILPNDNERSLSQRTSPTPSQRSGRQQYSSRSQQSRRGKFDFELKLFFCSIFYFNKIEKEKFPQPSETDSSLKTNENPEDTSKRSLTSTKIRQAVSMHPVIGFSSEPIDIQFGDLKWKDSLLIEATPSNSPIDDEHMLQINQNEDLNEYEFEIELDQSNLRMFFI